MASRPAPILSLKSVLLPQWIFAFSRGSGMQGTTTANLKNQELCCWGCLGPHFKQVVLGRMELSFTK